MAECLPGRWSSAAKLQSSASVNWPTSVAVDGAMLNFIAAENLAPGLEVTEQIFLLYPFGNNVLPGDKRECFAFKNYVENQCNSSEFTWVNVFLFFCKF